MNPQMMIVNSQIDIPTQGDNHVIDLTQDVRQAVAQSAVADGLATVFVVGSTAGITTTEFEPGLTDHDLAAAFERIAPRDAEYLHEQTWHDDNGHSHVRASLLGPSLTVPIVHGQMTLGTWQQIVLMDFDTRPRTRRIVIQIIGNGDPS